MARTGASPETVIAAKGLAQVSDADALETEVDRVLEANPKEVAAYRGGKTKLMGFFVGQVMRATRGQANPKMVNSILKRKLDNA
jgi:aspartyl-tRNA(Asn)/glutamyl-tRNA(Gln) amidotransferase subunit B